MHSKSLEAKSPNQELDNFFEMLQAERRAFKESYAISAAELAPQFNIFNFVRRDENALSFIIKSLLDPNGSHEQKEIFLTKFIETLKEVRLDEKLEDELKDSPLDFRTKLPDSKQYEWIETEYSTKKIAAKGRRIDIMIKFQDFGIAIENKPWAFDQPNQLQDYAEEMMTWFPNGNWLLIYLSGYDAGPSEESIRKAKRDELNGENYIQIGFGEIFEWLNECEAECKSERVRHFLRDFSEYCNNEFLGGSTMADANVIRDYVLKTDTNLALALDIQAEMDTVKLGLLDKFFIQIQSSFEKSHQGWLVEKDKKFGIGHGNNQIIWFKKPGWKNHALAIGSDSYDGFYFGIKKLPPTIDYLPLEDSEKINFGLNSAFKLRYYTHSLFKAFDGYKGKEIIKDKDFLVDINSDEPKYLKVLLREISGLATASESIIDEVEGIVIA